MKGLIVALAIMGAVLLSMCSVYKRINNRNMLKDLWNDLRWLIK